MTKLRFTEDSVRALPPSSGPHRIDYDTGDVRGFAVQTTYTGNKRFLLVYSGPKTRRERKLVLGEFGRAPKLSVAAARRIAAEKRAMVSLGRDPWEELDQVRKAAKERRAPTGASFGDLLTAYVESLRRSRKPSAAGVEREIRATIERPFKKLWNMAAVDVPIEELVRVLHRLTKAEKWRQAEKTRSYIRAAYTAAAASRGKANAADLFVDFSNIPNIGRDLATIERPKDADDGKGKRALTEKELAAYWQRIESATDPGGALLRAHLLTGAQRCAQLARLTWRSVGDDAITLLDGKGRRKKMRQHAVPLLAEATAAFLQLRGDQGEFAFSLDGGKSGAGFHAVRRKVAAIAEDMVAANEVDSPFTPGELRISVETRLAAAGIPMEVRAHLQSHGLGGVQNKHYDKHDYLAEKRAALDALLRLIRPATCNVVQFPQIRSA